MKTVHLVFLIHEKTGVPTADVSRVLRELGILTSNELQANETVSLPLLGRLVPLEQTAFGEKRRRVVTFEPSPALRKKLANPFRRLRSVTS
ncbi:hypothetical protein [Rhodanobacter denitrificans]|uniref:Uncharacterized protein n=1 Tax=Rhodanobacter denitrificans TaxID=666685 RepID=M4NMX8_9GAMM|nr:hypothetical protein [Rhodanobacter denitrificans]AGG89036.1 hypothetical protein R2APBS1_1913 [Rhodanobacter denitrificans]UJJ53065.1 hypothetical protein LRK52_18335 [Rhodanobacter denitrificans]